VGVLRGDSPVGPDRGADRLSCRRFFFLCIAVVVGMGGIGSGSRVSARSVLGLVVGLTVHRQHRRFVLVRYVHTSQASLASIARAHPDTCRSS
jgi:hypothetical protein